MNRTMKWAFGLAAFIVISSTVTAQEAAEATDTGSSKWAHNVGFTGAFGLEEPTRISALDYALYYGFGDNKRVQVGPGLRGFVYTGEFVWYPTLGTANVGR